ncbi:MAG TPA: SPOR domain-containing protein [Candidatus Deferrimicrobium sp.]|nr:SPOR domain-containing protein [Candidatus Deferrimicrobium sp.]
MRTWQELIFIGMAILLAAGCARKKEAVAQLEQEMQEPGVAVVEASTLKSEGPVDSTPRFSPPADAGAIPREEASVLDAAAIPDEALPVRQPEPETGGFEIQIAATESRGEAEFLVGQFTARGYRPYLSTAVVNGKTFYRVRLGGLESMLQAQQLKAELADKYGVNGWVAKR